MYSMEITVPRLLTLTLSISKSLDILSRPNEGAETATALKKGPRHKNIGIGDAAGNILGEYQIVLCVLFQKRYGSMVNSKK